MKKENVFPTRRSIIPTLSITRTNAILNTDFGEMFYPKFAMKSLWAIYQKKGKKFYLIVSKKKVNGMTTFYVMNKKAGKGNTRTTSQVYHFEELKSSDVPRYRCIPVKTTLRNMDVYELKPYAFDSVKSLQFFDFKIKI